MAAPPAEPGLTITNRRLGGRHVLTARGRIDSDTAPQLHWVLSRVAPSEQPVALDLCAAEVTDDAGTALLLNAMRRLRAQQRELVVVCSQESFRRALDRTGLARRFELVGDAGAITDLPRRAGGSEGAKPRASVPSAGRRSTVARRAALLADATLVIEQRHGEPDLVLDDVAHEIATSSRQLQRVFAELAGSSFRDELAAVRMQHGATLLQTTDLSVREIARRAGYRQSAQFAKAFGRHHGTSPSLFRRNARRRTGARVSPSAHRTAPTPA